MQYGVELEEQAKERFKEFSDESRDTVTLSDPISFGDRKFHFRLNNALSQNERIAEKTAFRLLEETFNDLKIDERLPWIPENSTEIRIFLLAVTQEFCKKMSLMDFTIQAIESSVLPPQFRIENILSNSENF
ncbi:hypothetical protein WA026_007948 [Henosepilachna vigintioctopunctata]|uniref:Uncharacterized protein n=1 Tax=Henosepilachna vigintioctopunctata TaxID=420089 RepID=A0AAW1TPW8_9CUCU